MDRTHVLFYCDNEWCNLSVKESHDKSDLVRVSASHSGCRQREMNGIAIIIIIYFPTLLLLSVVVTMIFVFFSAVISCVYVYIYIYRIRAYVIAED